MSLDHYTDQALIDELLNRRLEKERGWDNVEYCHNCARFKPWTRRGEPPADYNPCGLGHKLHFRMPEDWEDPHCEHGFYRRICSDRAVIEPPAPGRRPPPAVPPRGRPGWAQSAKPSDKS